MTTGLVADIGGTHARFALVTDDGARAAGRRAYRVETVYECRGMRGVHELLDQYRERAGGALPKSACIAVAGPINGDVVNLTNLDWRFSIDALRDQYGFDQLEVVNDLQATASALPDLEAADLVCLKPGRSMEGGTRAVVGVGTGLGLSAAVHDGERWITLASEGGHAAVGPADDTEARILSEIGNGATAVSAETLLSGPGLVRLYHALNAIAGNPPRSVVPEYITAAAGSDSDPLAGETIRVFSRLLGRFASNAGLSFCATGGVYLSGQLLRAMAPALATRHFSEAFATDGPMKALLAKMPVHLITASQPGLIGAQARLALD